MKKNKIRIKKVSPEKMKEYTGLHRHLPKNELPKRFRHMRKEDIYIRSDLSKKRQKEIIRHEKIEIPIMDALVKRGVPKEKAYKRAHRTTNRIMSHMSQKKKKTRYTFSTYAGFHVSCYRITGNKERIYHRMVYLTHIILTDENDVSRMKQQFVSTEWVQGCSSLIHRIARQYPLGNHSLVKIRFVHEYYTFEDTKDSGVVWGGAFRNPGTVSPQALRVHFKNAMESYAYLVHQYRFICVLGLEIIMFVPITHASTRALAVSMNRVGHKGVRQ